MAILSPDPVTERLGSTSASVAHVKPRVVAAVGWLALLGLVLSVLLPASPLIQQLPSWDSGVFMYTGWRVREGAVPYRDVWDHKPPLIYAIDAVGVLLGGSSRWGIWVAEARVLFEAQRQGATRFSRSRGKYNRKGASAFSALSRTHHG